MPEPIVYEVAPIAAGWVVRIPSDSLSESFERKADAVARARELAARDRAGLRVLSEAGGVELEYAPPRPVA